MRFDDPQMLRVWRTWIQMRYRCRSVKKYSGITVCDSWNNRSDGFANFLRDMGIPDNGKSMDRIDGSKGYSPDNCRWATVTIQNRNRRTIKLSETIVFHARRLYAMGISGRRLARILGVSPETMRDALIMKTWKTNGLG
jgi:hypothetical protein